MSACSHLFWSRGLGGLELSLWLLMSLGEVNCDEVVVVAVLYGLRVFFVCAIP